MTHNFSALFFFLFVILSPYPTHQKQTTTRPTINALLKHCVLIGSSLKYLHSVLVKVPALCFKGSNLIASRCVTWLAHLHVKFCTINALLKQCVLIASSLKYLRSVLVKVPALCFKGSNLIASRCVTWLAHLHVKFCTINALLKQCVLIASSLKYLRSVLVKVPALCFKGSNLIASR